MKKPGLLIPGLFALATLCACTTPRDVPDAASPYRDPAELAEGQILHLATGRLLSEQELYANLSHFRVVYVGEAHDNLEAHRVQLAILTEMHRRFPGQVAVGMEMLRRPHQSEVDAYLAGKSSEREFLRAWDRSWGLRSYPYYSELLAACRRHGIPVLALNADPELEAAVLREPRPEHPQLPDMDLGDTYYRATLEAYFEAHAGGSAQVDTFHRMQVLRDETMAATAADYLQGPQGADKRLLVFAGANHVRYGFGIPRRLYRRLPVPYAVVDTFITAYPESKRDSLMEVTLPPLPLRPADFYWAVGYQDLSAQSVRLGVQVEDVADGFAKVESVVSGGSAGEAGVVAGDLIVSVDGEPVGDSFDLSYSLLRCRPGESGSIAVRRNGETIELKITYAAVDHRW